MDISSVAKKILDVIRRELKLDLVRDKTGEFKYMPSAFKISCGDRSIKITMMMEHSIKNFEPIRQPVYVTVEIPTVAETITSKGMSELTVKIEDSNTWPHKFNIKERVDDLQASLRAAHILEGGGRMRRRSRKGRKGRNSRKSSKRTKSRTKD